MSANNIIRLQICEFFSVSLPASTSCGSLLGLLQQHRRDFDYSNHTLSSSISRGDHDDYESLERADVKNLCLIPNRPEFYLLDLEELKDFSQINVYLGWHKIDERNDDKDDETIRLIIKAEETFSNVLIQSSDRLLDLIKACCSTSLRLVNLHAIKSGLRLRLDESLAYYNFYQETEIFLCSYHVLIGVKSLEKRIHWKRIFTSETVTIGHLIRVLYSQIFIRGGNISKRAYLTTAHGIYKLNEQMTLADYSLETGSRLYLKGGVYM